MKKIDFSKLPDQAPEYDLRELLELGCHFGHSKNKWNPLMEDYIYTEKNGVHIFDLAKTAQQLQQAYNYVYQLGKKKKTLIMVGTKRQAREIVREVAEEVGAMYITSRWLGGFLTNWDQVSKSLKRMLKIEAELKEGGYEGYTKYEISQIKKELSRLRRFFEGVRDLKGKPDALFIVDPTKEENAVKEANSEDVPVVALIDSDGDPNQVDLPIPANDDAVKCVEFMVRQIGQAYKKGQEA
ncbi:MAG: 30S ribosomal protein S2 [Candidatus Pacebacteria bacterium]|nr:30S ribosomal protein S2 [Candidatus Paceibacterota bacterium]